MQEYGAWRCQKPEKEHVIVIEVDNKRAAAAYQKGLEELDLIWGQLEAWAVGMKKKQEEDYEKKLAEWDRKKERLDAKEKEVWVRRWWSFGLKIYDADASLWNATKDNYLAHIWPDPSFIDHVKEINSLRQELVDMKTLSQVAIAPLRITKQKVKEMVAWENGERIDLIKRKIEQLEAIE